MLAEAKLSDAAALCVVLPLEPLLLLLPLLLPLLLELLLPPELLLELLPALWVVTVKVPLTPPMVKVT